MTIARGFSEGEYYHLFNRGVGKTVIVKNDIDRVRFLFSVLYYQSSNQFDNVNRLIKKYSPETGFSIPHGKVEDILENRGVELVSFCLMSNHFHLLVREKIEGGIAAYIGRIQNAHTRYMNTKYGTSGHLFESRYKAVHVKNNNQLLYLSAYIHKNPREIASWKDKYFEYPWSSLQDMTEANRWGGLLSADIIAEQFSAEPNSNYKDFVKMTNAKDLQKEIEWIAP